MPRLDPVRIAVLISGNGSNLQALIDQIAAMPEHPGSIAMVVSNNEHAYGIERAKQAGIPVVILPHRIYTTRNAYDEALHAVLTQANIEFVCLAGFMRLLTETFTEAWTGRMINIHPSLLPAYKGLNTHQRVLEAGEKETGCSVHYVSPEMDAGEIIMQQTVTVQDGDTPETLQQRVHATEHELYPKALLKALGAL